MIDADHITTTVAGTAGRIAVVDHGGQGPDVVLLHGAHRSLLDWEAVRPALSGLRLIAYDLRGHGRSDPPADDDYGWEAHLGDLDAVIAALGLRNPHLVGHSLGGMIAVRHAATRPGCPGVVDLDGFGGGVPGLYPGLSAAEVARRRGEQLAMFTAMAGPEHVDAAQSREIIAAARTAAAAQGWNPDLEEANARRGLTRAADGSRTRRPAPRTLPALMAPLEGWDMFAELRHLACPALVVQGGRRPTLDHLPPDLQELTESLIAGITHEIDALRRESGLVRAVRIDGAAHMVHLDAPEVVGRLIRDFVLASM
ncbi:alpha/beta hydrolase [Amycolatopsis rhizosphaerae]|uniref:Alpha/beta hydrolase n=1 Tax=Amycolatopsis rhizosphaerae TaxID=2053003 RepID=A0A558A747_9PSEU|nr:alpha/beta hydrolase [Amycolatopsis rhizosphaerae]TVT20066.1 alpha/beta hydrolase [Amycolatopsis rhizosphaerae]